MAQDSLLLRDYQFVKQQDVWLTHPNAAALTRLQSPSIVEAEAQLAKGNGGHIDFYDSRNTLQATVNIESYYRLSRRVVGFGAISYDNWTGRDMTGSAFLPMARKASSVFLQRRPFDLVEDSLTNSGRKHRDTYRLSGAIGVDIWRGISLGARIDYTAANYAKYKDLRHKNKLMDLQITVGAYAPVTEWLSLGANYAYHRQTESITFGTYGKSEKVYKTLIDYGAFMGRVEQFGYEGFTDKSHEMPLFEDGHGGSFQLELRPFSGLGGRWQQLALMGAVSLAHSTGYYGRRSPYTITYTGHKRDIVEVMARLSYAVRAARYALDFSFGTERLDNHAETYREQKNDNGATFYEYYDPVETGSKKWHDMAFKATAQWGVRGELPAWELTAGYQWAKRRQTAYLYPFFRYQRLTANRLTASATHNHLMAHGVLSVNLHGSWQKGNGDPCQDGAFVVPSDRQEMPATMEAFLQREYHYLTAAQFGVGGSVKYAFRFPGTKLRTHVRLGADYRKVNGDYDYATGNHHWLLTAAVGCTF